MSEHRIISREDWLNARATLLEKEKEFTRMRDSLSELRRSLPWVKVDKEYAFEGEAGVVALSDLFAGKSQLIIYHFMFGPSWEEGCPSCSFWADNFDGVQEHLAQRDVSLVMVAKAPDKVLQKYSERMGWDLDWYSSGCSDFNEDYHVSFSSEEMEKGEVFYNYRRTSFPSEEAPGISVFFKDGQGQIFHTYSTYARGLDMVNGAYHLLDLTSKGRDEDQLPYTMAWLKRRDQYVV